MTTDTEPVPAATSSGMEMLYWFAEGRFGLLLEFSNPGDMARFTNLYRTDMQADIEPAEIAAKLRAMADRIEKAS